MVWFVCCLLFTIYRYLGKLTTIKLDHSPLDVISPKSCDMARTKHPRKLVLLFIYLNYRGTCTYSTKRLCIFSMKRSTADFLGKFVFTNPSNKRQKEQKQKVNKGRPEGTLYPARYRFSDGFVEAMGKTCSYVGLDVRGCVILSTKCEATTPIRESLSFPGSIFLCETHYEEMTVILQRLYGLPSPTRNVSVLTRSSDEEMLLEYVNPNIQPVEGATEDNMREEFTRSDPGPLIIRYNPGSVNRNITGRKKLSSTIRSQCWQKYAQIFCQRFLDDHWFKKRNPVDRAFTVIRCWCCGMQELSAAGYSDGMGNRFPTFECGHVIAQSLSHNDDISNLRPICSDCNKRQGTSHMRLFATQCGYRNRYASITKEVI